MGETRELSALWATSDLFYPLATLLVSGLAICVATRLFTAYVSSREGHTSLQLPARTIPYWIPLLGHGPALALAQISGRRQSYLLDSALSAGGVCALNVFGKRSVVVADPKLRRRLVTAIRGKGRGGFTQAPFETQRLWKVFGASSATARKLIELAGTGVGDVNGLLTDEGFANDAAGKLAKQLETATSRLISKSTSWVDHSPWERAAVSELIPNGDVTAEAFTVTAKLYALITHFTVPLVCASILSPTFTAMYDNFAPPFLKFAANYERFSSEIPYWLFSGSGPAGWGREQCLQALESFIPELAPRTGPKEGQVDRITEGVQRDVHPLLIQTIKNLQAAGISDGGIACWLLSVVFDVTWSTTNAVFWALLFANRDQKSELICGELAKSRAVQVIRDENAHAKFKEPTRVVISTEKLFAATASPKLGKLVEEVYSTAVFADESYLAREDLHLDSDGGAKDKQGGLAIKAGDVLFLAGPRAAGQASSQHHESIIEGMTKPITGKLLLVLIAGIVSLHRIPESEHSANARPSATNVVGTVATPNVQGKQQITQYR